MTVQVLVMLAVVIACVWNITGVQGISEIRYIHILVRYDDFTVYVVPTIVTS